MSQSRIRITGRSVLRFRLLIALVVLAGAAVYLRAAPIFQERRLQAASLEQLQTASRREPGNARVFYYLGLHLQGLGQLEAAQNAYVRAVSLDPDGLAATIRDLHQSKIHAAISTDSLVQDADAMLARNDLDDAECGFTAILARDSHSSVSYYSLGLILDARGKTDEAFRAFSRAASLQPTLFEARYQLALLYYRSGFPDEAERRMIPLTQEAPAVARYWYGLGNCVKDDDSLNLKAQADFRRAFALDPKSGECVLALADTEAKAHQDEAAERDYRLALALSPGDSAPALALGVFLSEHKLSPEGQAEAVRLLQTALTLSPHDPAVLTGLGQAALNQGKPSEAVARLEEAEVHAPSDPKIWYILGTAYGQLNNKPRADYCRAASVGLTDYIRQLGLTQELAQKNLADPKLRLRLARLYDQGGQYARAINQYQMCRRLDPNNGAAPRELTALSRRLQASGQMPSMSAFNGMMIASVKIRPR